MFRVPKHLGSPFISLALGKNSVRASFLACSLLQNVVACFPQCLQVKAEELTGDKVARIRGNNVEKASFRFALAQSLQGFEVRAVDVRENRTWTSGDGGTRYLRQKSRTTFSKQFGLSSEWCCH